MDLASPKPTIDVDAFIERWSSGEGGQERANYALFLTELCGVLGVSRPDQASHDASANAYTFERAVTFRGPDGSKSPGRIDLYKRACFVLEAKQSRRPGAAKAVPMQGDLLSVVESEITLRGKRSSSRAWDVLMMQARQQAEDYAKALPTSEGWPPFLVVCDVGHCFEVFADFSGQGKNYAQFPDRQGFRIFLEDLRDDAIRERLRLIWLDPHKLDPTKSAAKATRAVAERLAKVSKHLEDARGPDRKPLYDPKSVALFLMRCLFTMFAEDVELLPKGSFREVLGKCVANPELFPRLVGQLWEAMDTGGSSYALERDVKKFNGYLFKNRTAFKLRARRSANCSRRRGPIGAMSSPRSSARCSSRRLNPIERHKLGAHYTPRAYVERLVMATVIEPLREEWIGVRRRPSAASVTETKGRRRSSQRFTAGCARCASSIRPAAPAISLRIVGTAQAAGRRSAQCAGSAFGRRGRSKAGIAQRRSAPVPRAGGQSAGGRDRRTGLWIGYLQWHFRTRGGAPAGAYHERLQ